MWRLPVSLGAGVDVAALRVCQIVHSLRPDLVASMTLASTWTHYGEEGAAGRIAYCRERLATKTMMEGSIGDAGYLLAPGMCGYPFGRSCRALPLPWFSGTV